MLIEGKDGMTRIEAEVTGGLSGGREGGFRWSEILVPIVTAALVIALGLALVGLTSDGAESPPGRSSEVETVAR